jgi:hypothetical protein
MIQSVTENGPDSRETVTESKEGVMVQIKMLMKNKDYMAVMIGGSLVIQVGYTFPTVIE